MPFRTNQKLLLEPRSGDRLVDGVAAGSLAVGDAHVRSHTNAPLGVAAPADIVDPARQGLEAGDLNVRPRALKMRAHGLSASAIGQECFCRRVEQAHAALL